MGRILYEFGGFQMDPERRVLSRGGAPVPLTPKAFDILLLLVERRGEVVGKDQLMALAWPDVAVEENNLTRNISTVRKSLGESPGEHDYIVTVPGRGYRFVAEVSELGEGGGPTTAGTPAVGALTRDRLRVSPDPLRSLRSPPQRPSRAFAPCATRVKRGRRRRSPP
jgi:serine/threonine-protein kinase